MSPVLVCLAALFAAAAGFGALSLAMDRHHEDSFGRGRTAGRWRRWLQLGGGLGLLVSLVLCLQPRGAGIGMVLWCGILTAAGLAVALGLAYAPHRSPRLLLASCGLVLVLLALAAAA